MKTSIEHLPPEKQEVVNNLVALIRDSGLQISMILLFGSQARGDDVEEFGIDQEDGSCCVSVPMTKMV